MKFSKQTKNHLIELSETKKIFLEGNILKLIDPEEDTDFQEYIKTAIEKDKEQRKKRLDITKQIQLQNRELISWKEEHEKSQISLMESLKKTEESMMESNKLREEAEKSREEAEKSRIEAELAREEAVAAKIEAENAKATAEGDLDLIQKKVQFELIGTIVRASLYVILGVGVATTGMYIFAILAGADTATISSTWSNIIGILLTNAFSIVGTIMGVKYASEKAGK